MNDYRPDEMMVVAAARLLDDHSSCYLGIGPATEAAMLAQRTHAPNLRLFYESGCIDAAPTTIPGSIGDPSLLATADVVVSVPFMLNYLVSAGRIDVGAIGAAQIDKFGNINSSIIGGGYRRTTVRLAGPASHPEVGYACGRVHVLMRHSPRSFVEKVDFVTCFGYGSGRGERERWGMTGGGPTAVVTDLGLLRPDLATAELTLAAVHPGVEVDDVVAATGWDLRVRPDVGVFAAPTEAELTILRRLRRET
ncbi:3-oxoadipate--succinyl-CoA transferase subunit B [Amycolatopsis antarctica]|uniref:3-oxoadipate--succinyl-CoA transferase subunit B n=1 Tax=Amycolatopsis antarctica TaxID=1854586 RepID=A0A263D1B6_9PSEU|nr:CoA-transferase [Amycolatopsis antarctica]OZM72141.1 3-oxoadipate--succinyl-CoA transferase subunit B [Amycolatopsis antarctica]